MKLKTAFQLTSLFWILSPGIFFILRYMGPYNHPADSYIMIFFAVMSAIFMFLSYKTHGWE